MIGDGLAVALLGMAATARCGSVALAVMAVVWKLQQQPGKPKLLGEFRCRCAIR